MKPNRLSIFTFAIVAIVLTSCSKITNPSNDKGPSVPASDIITRIDIKDGDVITFQSSSGKLTQTFTKVDSSSNSESFAVVEKRGTSGPEQFRITQTTAGIYFLDTSEAGLPVFVEYPLTVGRQIYMGAFTLEVKSYESIRIGTANYLCARVEGRSPHGSKLTVYINKDIFVAKMVLETGSNTYQEVFESRTRQAAYVSQVKNLDYTAIDAEYSAYLNKLVIISSKPNQLHIIDPETKAEQIVLLPQIPLCLALDKSGRYAAIGYDGWVSTLDLSNIGSLKNFASGASVKDVAIKPPFVYFVAAAQNENSGLVYTLDSNSGVKNTDSNWRNRNVYKISLDVSQDVLMANSYSNFLTFSVTGNIALYRTESRTTDTDGGFWLTEEGAKTVVKSGNVYNNSDFSYAGRFSELSTVQSASHSVILKKLFIIPKSLSSYGKSVGDSIQVYDDQYLAFERTIAIPDMIANGRKKAYGKYAFASTDGKSLYVVVSTVDNYYSPSDAVPVYGFAKLSVE